MNRMVIAALAALSIALGGSDAAFAGTEDIVIERAWARASIGTNRPGAAYMTLRNNGDEPVTLTGIRTEIAMMPEVHRTSTDDRGVSSMAPAGDITVAPGEIVALQPGGLHAMLMKLQRPMNEGESFRLTLLFSDGTEITIEVPILEVGARGPGG